MAQIEQTKTPSPAPESPGAPILGVLPQVWKDTLGFFLRAGTQNPDVVQLKLGTARFFLVSHPDGVKYVLQDNNRNYAKGYERAKPVLGEGLVSSEGELWRRQRRLMQPAFHRQKLAELHPIMVESTREMIERWRKRNLDEPLDLAREMMLLTQTIIVRTMFSSDVGGRGEAIGDAFATTLEFLNLGLFSPFPFAQSLPTPIKRRFTRAKRLIDETVSEMIEERRRTGVKRQDLLQMLIDARDEETGEGMSDQQMHDEVLTIFLAGHETTATLLAWTFHLLIQNPSVEQQSRAEVEQVLGGADPGPESVMQLAYTGQVLHESLRVYPPVWMFARQSVEDDEIGGYHIPAGVTIMLSPYVTHRLPQIWDQPDRFDPGRFTPEASAGRPRYAFFPFGGGPRLCIGNNFALMEAPTILSMVMQAFRFQPIPGYAVKPIPYATIRPRPGVHVHLKPLS